MSLSIDTTKFPNLAAALKEIERIEESRASSTTEPVRDGVFIKERSFSMKEPQPSKRHNMAVRQRQNSDPTGHTSRLIGRTQLPTIDVAKILCHPRLTPAAKELSNEELTLLYEDILKPLDPHSILNESRKQAMESGEDEIDNI